MFKDLPPEERLLRLIRRKDKPKTKPSEQTPVKKDMYISRWKSIFQQVKVSGSVKKELVDLTRFKIAQKVLLAVIILTLVYIGFVFLSPIKDYGLRLKKTIDTETEAVAVQGQIEKPKPYDFYSQQFDKRDIFGSPFLEDGEKGSSAKDTLQGILKTVKLVGIILDNVVPQAIIEDTKEQKTYFLSKGEYFNQAKIEEILEGKVIFSFEGEKAELVP